MITTWLPHSYHYTACFVSQLSGTRLSAHHIAYLSIAARIHHTGLHTPQNQSTKPAHIATFPFQPFRRLRPSVKLYAYIEIINFL